MQRIIKKEELSSKLKELLKEYELIAPKELPNKGIFYQAISDIGDLYLGGNFTVEPVKKFFLEPSFRIFRRGQDNMPNIETVNNLDKKRIIIGSRPCETRGLELLDKVFDIKIKDSFYVNNRRNTIIIGLACDEPDKCCFCASMAGSPVETRGMDVLLFTAGEKYIIDIVTERAKAIFGSLGQELDEEGKRSWKRDKEKRINGLQKKISPPQSMDNTFKSDYWKEVSQPCLSCGVCTFLCPTCHCFDLIDEDKKRLRCYDGCAFPDFTLEASGENPRPTKKERYRQRVFHKFDYFKKNFGENLCVGCGRCIRYCPVKIDIADIVAKMPFSPHLNPLPKGEREG
ncbi:MAG: 4Fe-4S dicluster domain-containing protein [Candidatus Omnitrophota bacterium]|nr:4Fe-4S dicluster domain-containing protein [Candidatus Omnitrophota bacterium]